MDTSQVGWLAKTLEAARHAQTRAARMDNAVAAMKDRLDGQAAQAGALRTMLRAKTDEYDVLARDARQLARMVGQVYLNNPALAVDYRLAPVLARCLPADHPLQWRLVHHTDTAGV